MELNNGQCVFIYLLNLLTPWIRVRLGKLTKKFPAFFESEDSLSHLQVPATCPYIEPDQSNPCTLFLFLRSILILSSHLRMGNPSDLFPSGPLLPPKNLYKPLISPVSSICPAHHILPDLITRIKFDEECR